MTARSRPTTDTPETAGRLGDHRTPGSAIPRRVTRWVWLGLLLLLVVWVAFRLGLHHATAVVATPGGPVRLPDTFASVDHPFHAVRAETLRRALADGHLLRWIGHHQGGYPVEFYPLGVAWLEVAVWALSLGTLSILVVHKLAVVLIFLLPGLGFALMARRDGWPLPVAVAATAAHVAVPGAWWHGGYTELVQWGLVTNVAASVALLFVLVWLTAYVDEGRGSAAAGAAVAAAFALSTNPRSSIALGVVGAGVWLTVALRPGSTSGLGTVTRRLAVVGALTAVLAAPELVALARFSDLYDFVRYTGYASPAEYVRSAVEAVSRPVFVLGVGGAAIAWMLPRRPVTQAAALTLLLYAVVTLLLARPDEAALVSQLEATRLMPFQRLLTIYLAAVALFLLARWLVAGFGAAPLLREGLLIGGALALLVARAAPAGGEAPDPALPTAPERALYPVATTAEPEQADFQEAIEAADAATPPGTAILVLGSAVSWHQQLWAPLWTDRPLLYDNWLWYWHAKHAGPPGYEHAAGHHYPYPELALEPGYLDRHGIGAVVVTDRAKAAAAVASSLSPIRSGVYDVYVVREPTTIVTLAGTNATDSEIDDQRLLIRGESPGGQALIRRNWHPRWRATVNGEPAAIARTADGYMTVAVPAGAVRLELVYGVDALDWLARLLFGIGVIAAAWLALRPGRREPNRAAGEARPA